MTVKNNEKEREAKIKAIRRELDQELQDQLEEKGFLDEVSESRDVGKETLRTEDLEDPEKAKCVIEALIFAASKPLSLSEIRKTMKILSAQEIKKKIEEIREEYVNTGRPFEVIEIAGGYEISTKREFAPWILKIELQKKARQASQSALETLAILAYKQPLTRAEIEELRGVDTSGVLGTLMDRKFVKIVGKKEVPGRPFVYGTTEKFLEHFGLNVLGDLPSIEEIKQLVESSVKREDLLGTSKIIEVEEGNGESSEEETVAEENQAASREGEKNLTSEGEENQELESAEKEEGENESK